jgi:hypothetical protein
MQQRNTAGKSTMKDEHPVSRIARLVYDCYDCKDSEAAMAAELRISPADLTQWLAGDLAPPTRLLMKGFAAKKAAVLQQRARQLINLANTL